MAARTAPAAAGDIGAELAFLTRALKAPTLRTSVARLAERARAEGWTMRSSWPPACNARSPHESPMAARAASATPASRPARAWRSSTSTTPAASTARSSRTWARWTSWPPGRTWSSWARPAPARPTWPSAWGSVPARPATECSSPPPGNGSPAWPTPTPPAGCSQSCAAGPLPTAGHRRGRLHPLRTRSRQLDALPCGEGAAAGVVTYTVTGVCASGRGSRPDGATGG
jgi:hypothetical protein